jgi:Flp pilus assembly pilin Flp
MTNLIKDFVQNEDGVAVVDMTMLMAALVGLALAVTTQISAGLEDITGELEAVIVAQDAEPSF